MSRGPDNFISTPEPLSQVSLSETTPRDVLVEQINIPVSEQSEITGTAVSGSMETNQEETQNLTTTVSPDSSISCQLYATGSSSGVIQSPYSGDTAGSTESESPDLFEYSSVIEAQESYINSLSTCESSKEKMLSFVKENTNIQWFPVKYGQKYIMVSRDFIKDSSGNYIRVSTGSAPVLAKSYGARPPNSAAEASAIFNSSQIFKLEPKGSGSGGGANQIGTPAGDSEKAASDSAFRENTALNNSVALVDGHLKTVYTTGIFGGSKTGGSNVYQSGSNPHGSGYADYSQGLRLVALETFEVC